MTLEDQHELIAAHMAWADTGANKYTGRYGHIGHTFEEFQSAAFTGLVEAARRFDPSRGFTFKTYAMNWTEQEMRRILQRHTRFYGGAYLDGVIRNRIWQADWPRDEHGEIAERNYRPIYFVPSKVQRPGRIKEVLEACRDDRERTAIRLRLEGVWKLERRLRDDFQPRRSA